MTKEPELMQLWSKFRDSPEYDVIKNVPQSEVKEAVTYFGEFMAVVFPGSVQRWTVTQVCDILTTMRQHVPASDSDQAAQKVNDQVVQALLRYLARTAQINISQAVLAQTLKQLDQDTADMTLSYTRQINPAADLPEWRAYTVRDIHIYTHSWLVAYIRDTAAWAQRPAGVTSEFLIMIFNALSDWAYDEFRKTPRSWTKKVLRALLTGPFISNLTLSLADYQRLVPALKALLAYAGAECDLNSKRASDYQRFLTDIEPEVLTAAQAKLADASTSSKPAPQKSTEQVPDPLLADAADLLADPKKLIAVAKERDPEPEQAYLKQQHTATRNGHKWQRQRAVKVHKLGVRAALTLWLRQTDHSLPQGWDATMTIGNMSGFIDLLYAQYLVSPANWENAILRDFGEWSRRNQPDSQDQLQVITSLIGVLAEMQVLDHRQALQLPAALQGKTVPTVTQPKKVKGKAISIKKVRQLLRRKHH